MRPPRRPRRSSESSRMAPELGHLALILALLIALIQALLPLVGAHRGHAGWIALARPAAQTQFVLVLMAFACLMQAFVANDFSVAYVAAHSNSRLPAVHRAAAVWGGHEGSLLLWLLMLNGWTLAVSLLSHQLPQAMVARVIGVLGLVAAGFLMFMLFTSDPFERALPGAADGQDLNPLLQDPGLVFHPPMLYMGYVGFSVAFAFAIPALHLHPAVPDHRDRRLARPLRLARGQGQPGRRLCGGLARDSDAREQRAADGGGRLGVAGHALPADRRRARPGQALGRTALLQRGVHATDAAAAVPDGRRPAGALEASRRARHGPAPAPGGVDRFRGRRGRAVAARPVDAAGRARRVAGGLDRRQHLFPGWRTS